MALRDDQVRRYARHVLLPDFGGVGQERLLAATAVVDLRDPGQRAALDYLVAAGVGTIVVDDALAPCVMHAARLNPDVRVVIDPASTGQRLALPPADADRVPGDELADALIRGGAAAPALLHRIATTPPAP